MAAFDEVVFPGLAQIEYDRHSLLIEDHRTEFAFKTAEALLDSADFNWPVGPDEDGRIHVFI